MWPFKKKIPSAQPIEPPPCNHKYKDFPAYLVYTYRDRSLNLKIQEPYVCIYCKKRKYITLVEHNVSGISKEESGAIIKQAEREYQSILKPQGIVEDMVNDFIMVDRQYLEIADSLHPERGILSNPYLP